MGRRLTLAHGQALNLRCNGTCIVHEVSFQTELITNLATRSDTSCVFVHHVENVSLECIDNLNHYHDKAYTDGNFAGMKQRNNQKVAF